MKSSKYYKYIEVFLTILFFFVLALTTLVHASPTERMSRDNGVFLYVGQVINESKLPYRDAWDNKPPAVFYVDALGLAIADGTRWGVWGLELICLLTAVLISYLTMKELWGQIPALGGTLLWLYGLDVLFDFDGGNFTEEYPLPLHFLSIYLLVRLLKKPDQRFLYLILGMNFGISFLFRPNNAMVELIVIGILAFAQLRQGALFRRLTEFALIAAGALSPIILTALYFARFGLFNEWFDATLLYNFSYSATKMGTQTPFERVYVVLGWVAWFATLGYALALLRFYKAIKNTGMEFYLYLFLAAGAPLCVFLSDLAQRGYEHYFINILPMLGFLSALIFHALIGMKKSKPGEKTYLVILTILLVTTSLYFVASGRKDRYFISTDFSAKNFWRKNQRFTPISKYVRLHSKPDDTVLFWGAWVGENFMASRMSASSIVPYPALTPSKSADLLNIRFLEDIKSNKPVLIVDMLDPFFPAIDPVKRERQPADLLWSPMSDNVDELLAYILDNYVLQEVFAGKDIYYRVETK